MKVQLGENYRFRGEAFTVIAEWPKNEAPPEGPLKDWVRSVDPGYRAYDRYPADRQIRGCQGQRVDRHPPYQHSRLGTIGEYMTKSKYHVRHDGEWKEVEGYAADWVAEEFVEKLCENQPDLLQESEIEVEVRLRNGFIEKYRVSIDYSPTFLASKVVSA